MREVFSTELDHLKEQFGKMFERVNQAFDTAIQSFSKQDEFLAQKIISEDLEINQQEVDIEMAGARLIALQQPVVADLRLILSIIQGTSDLERMGDHAASIAKTAQKLSHHQRMEMVETAIVDFAKQCLTLSQETHHCFMEMDWQKSSDIASNVKNLDAIRREIIETIRLMMKQDPSYVFNGAEYLSTLLHIKRIADYATNILERLVYIQTGQISELS